MLHLRGQAAHPVVQGLGVALDVGQGGAQLVGHVGHKVLALLLRPLQLGDVGLQLLGHAVEPLGELADLILRGDVQLAGEIPPGHPLDAAGEPLEGVDHGFGQQEGQQRRDHQAQHQRLHDEGEHLGVELAGGLPVVQDIDDIGLPPSGDGDGGVHVVGGDAAVQPRFPQQGLGDVGGDFNPSLRGGDGPVQAAAGGPVQHIIVAVAAVHPQHARVGGQHLAHHGRAVLVLFCDGLEVPDEVHVGLAEGVGDLLVELVDIVAGDRVHEERAHHYHQRHDQQHHDEHQLDMQAAAHGGASFRRRKVRSTSFPPSAKTALASLLLLSPQSLKGGFAGAP